MGKTGTAMHGTRLLSRTNRGASFPPVLPASSGGGGRRTRARGDGAAGPGAVRPASGSGPLHHVIKSFALRRAPRDYVTYDDCLITLSRDRSSVGSLDQPDQPDVPGRPIRADADGSSRDAHAPRELPDPDERDRAYEATLRHVSAETPAEASPAQRPDAGHQRSYGDDVPRFHAMRADHEGRRPEAPHAAADAPNNRPELPEATAAAVNRIRDAAPTLFPDGQVTQQENKQGGRLEGFEQRLNGEDRLQEKVPAVTTAEEASGGQPPDTADQRSYWDEVPRFLKLWTEHLKHWATARRVAVDRSADPAGSYRSDGGFYLNPERHAETIEAIRNVREVEPTISKDIRTIERENTYGCWLEGFKNRLKGEERLKEKVAERREGEPDKTSAEILREVPDAIRYTSCAQPESYTRAYYDIKERLESRGYEMYESRNTWGRTGYKGINTRWVTQQGQRFELQFHTPESHHAKEYVTHRAYERIRNPLTSDEEREELKTFQQEVCAHIQVPNSALDIPDFKKEGF
jgi:hypothetical protein